MSLESIRLLYDYHRWANRRLYDVAVAQGEEAAGRAVGPQFSYPPVSRMFGHLYGADRLWLERWNGTSPTRLPGGEFPTLAALRPAWDAVEREQQGFIESLKDADLERTVAYTSFEGKPFHLQLEPLLHHVANHATHHRSEIATMLTMIDTSPPDTGLVTYQLLKTGQR